MALWGCEPSSVRRIRTPMGRITCGLGRALGTIVRLISVTAENTWPQSMLRHWKMVSRLVLVSGELVRVYANSLQWGTSCAWLAPGSWLWPIR